MRKDKGGWLSCLKKVSEGLARIKGSFPIRTWREKGKFPKYERNWNKATQALELDNANGHWSRD